MGTMGAVAGRQAVGEFWEFREFAILGILRVFRCRPLLLSARPP